MCGKDIFINKINLIENNELYSCISIIINMLKNGISIENLPVIILSESVTTQMDEFLKTYDETLRFYGAYPDFVRTSQITMEFPQNDENDHSYKAFYETFNSFSKYQNRTYGVANICLRRCNKDGISKARLNSLYEFMKSNAGNCAFVLSDVSQEIIKMMKKELDGYFIFSDINEDVSSEKFVETYCENRNIAMSEELKIEFEKLLRDVPKKHWEKNISDFYIFMYQYSDFNNVQSIVEEYKKKVSKEEHERKIGFCI